MMKLSKEDIIQLATDETSIARAEKLARPQKWETLGQHDNVLWGECSGSASEPYLVIVDISKEPIFSCSCPVRKMPCKHCLGLLLLSVSSSIPSDAELPEKVEKWVLKQALKNQSTEQPITNDKPQAAEAKEKRDLARIQLMSNGLKDLELWLWDVVSVGIANLAHDNKDFWQNSAARFKDAKLSKVAYILREIADEFSVSTENSSVIANKIGQLSLLVKAFHNFERQDEDFKEEILNQLGRLLKKSEIIEKALPVNSKFLVFAIKETYNLDGLQERRVWLIDIKTGQNALIQDFIFWGNSSFEYNYKLGALYDMEVYYYPAKAAQRAVMFSMKIDDSKFDTATIGYPDFDIMQKQLSSKILLNPWLNFEAMILNNVIPFFDKNESFIVDSTLRKISLTKCPHKKMMKLLAISGGQPISVTGEYDFNSFDVLGVIKDGEIIAL